MSVFESVIIDDGGTFPQDDVPNKKSVKASFGKNQRGICKVCGDEAYDGRSVYCEEHRGMKSDSKPAASRKRGSNLEAQLTATLLPMAMLWNIKDPYCGGAMVAQTPAIVEALALQARNSPRLARALTSVTSTGGWLGIAAATYPVVMAVYMHHGMKQPIPSESFDPTGGINWDMPSANEAA